MADKNDWRLTGQERYLKAVKLHWESYKAPREDWDHDHCAFCRAKFAEFDLPEILHEGYTTEDSYHWVCEECFEDFKELFEWTVGSSRENSCGGPGTAPGPLAGRG